MATKSFGQVAFTPSQQAAKVRRVNSLARHDALLIRCDGTKGDLEGYRAGNTDTGWNCATPPRRDDLLIGVVGTGATRMIVSVCLVERVTRPGVAIWQEETDVSIKPAVAWRDVMRAAQQSLNAAELSLRAWPNVAGSRRGAVIDALCHCLENQTDSPEEEGKRQLRSCRSRSQLNRVKKLERSDGSCEVCGLSLRTLFGARGDRGLDIHHRVPLAKRGSGIISTSLNDLVVLCATCHRLLHADPDLSLERLEAGWARRF